MLTIDDVRAAARRLAGVAHRTPVVRSRSLDAATGATVHLKAESFQRTGSFKFRGAYNRLSSLTTEERRRGVAAFSSGNHAQAVALAAALCDVPATILMPADAPSSKVAATRGYGAEVVTFDRYADDREELAAELSASRGLTLVPPYDDRMVMAGQGTVALELCEQVPGLELLLVCVGGGGLIAGCATAAKALEPDIRVVGVEPAAGDDTKRSLEAGHRVRIPVPRTIADGQQVDRPGRLTFPVVQRLVDDVALVDDRDIVDAMGFAFERCKLVTEPSGASALAAMLSGRVPAAGLRVGVTISGGNIALDRLCELWGASEPSGPR